VVSHFSREHAKLLAGAELNLIGNLHWTHPTQQDQAAPRVAVTERIYEPQNRFPLLLKMPVPAHRISEPQNRCPLLLKML
jgi:hypothetical protein